MNPKITAEHIRKQAVVYVRQSTPGQVQNHAESRRRQYELAETAREMGFGSVVTIDEDLGKSGGRFVDRPGFRRMMDLVCSAEVGAVLALEASRLARNDRDWLRLVEFCAISEVVLIDHDGVYDPCTINDRLLLGLKGIMSEFEISTLRMRADEAKRQKAARGELRLHLPVGLVYSTSTGCTIELDPNRRVQQAIHLVFRKFRELGAIRQVMLWFRREQVKLPVSPLSKRRTIEWKIPKYSSVHEILTNPFYAAAYAYGRTEYRTTIVNGRPKRTAGHTKPIEDWDVLILEHHPGYIDWDEYLKNAALIEENAYMRASGRKSARGGHSLMSGLVRCRRCGYKIYISYTGVDNAIPIFRCARQHHAEGKDFCINFRGKRFDEQLSKQVLQVVESKSIEAAIEAANHAGERHLAQREALVLELEEARYQARLADHRYQKVDPDQRLIAAELEVRWNTALQRVVDLEGRLKKFDGKASENKQIHRDELLALAVDLPKVWNDASTDMRLKQRIARILIREILADIDEQTNEVILVIHWIGGRHSEIRMERNVRPKKQLTSQDAIALIRQMAGRWKDRDISSTLNRIGIRTATKKRWNEVRVRELRNRLKLPTYDPSKCDGTILTRKEAAERLGVSPQYLGRLLARGVIPGKQVVPGAPWAIQADVIDSKQLRETIESISRHRPRNRETEERNLRIPGL
jgi:DNA invertase Pin-like site-specific DNA recombinase